MNTLLVPLIRAELRDGSVSMLTLPGVLAALMDDRIVSFPALRAHQRHAWHAFLSQLGAIALHAADLREPPPDEATWRALLRALTPDDAEDHAWSLVAPPDRPALLQPPLPDGISALKNKVTTPDGLDMLETSRNHDFKQAIMMEAQPDDWLLALVTVQTMAPYGGRDHYAISRMKGNQGTRASVGVAPPGGPGAHARRDIARLLALRHRIAEQNDYPDEGGLALVWLDPWNGTDSLQRGRLDPLYIEICRRLRIVENKGALSAWSGTSKTERIFRPEEDGGNTGDPWAPIQRDQDGSLSVLTVQSGGLDYRRIVKLMFQEDGWQHAPLQEIADTDSGKDLSLLARVVARKNKKSAGYHERRVPLSRKVRFRGPTDPAAAVASARVELAAEMQGRVLRPALLALVQNGPDKIDLRKERDARIQSLLAVFDHFVDRSFFEDLWAEMEHDDEAARDAARAAWVRGLLAAARRILDRADEATPKAAHRRWRARVRAHDVLMRAAKGNDKLRPHLTEEKAHDTAA